jgi:hypothetical protein
MRYCFTIARVHGAAEKRYPELGSCAWATAAMSIADFRYEPISVGNGISFKFLRNHTAIQQRQMANYQA